MREEQIEKLRGVVRDCVSKHLYSSAISFADKVAAVTADPADIYVQAQALYLGRHYRRAFHLLNASQIVLRDLRFRYLAAKCIEQKQKAELLVKRRTRLGREVDEEVFWKHYGNDNSAHVPVLLGEVLDAFASITLKSFVDCTLGAGGHSAAIIQAHPEMEFYVGFDIDPAAHRIAQDQINNVCPRADLQVHTLLKNFKSIKSALQDIDGDRSQGVRGVLMDLGMSSMQVNNAERGFSVLCDGPLDMRMNPQNNTDLLACRAEYYHQCGEYQKCFELTLILLEKDPFHLKCNLVHLAAAMELGHSNELYLMACNLVKDYPQKALSWFAVGCYYYCIKKYDQSRRYFRFVRLANGLCVLLVHDLEIYSGEHSGDEKAEDEDEDGDEDEDEEDSADDDDDEEEDGDEEVKEPKGSAQKKAAAAMCVGTCSFADPYEAQGLAHFLEHMLFMGSTEFPDENEYDSFLSKHWRLIKCVYRNRTYLPSF